MPLQTDHAVELAIKNAPKPTSMESVKKGLELPPELLAMFGAGADAASTYGFLKNSPKAHDGFTRLQPGQQARTEDNAMFAGHGPAATAMGVLGSSLGTLALEKLLKHKMPGVANALMANQGAQSLGLAAENINPNKDSSISTLNSKISTAVRRKK